MARVERLFAVPHGALGVPEHDPIRECWGCPFDELSAEFLLLARELDELYERYDKLSAEVAGLKRRGAAQARELAALNAQASKLKSQLAKEQKEYERRKAELADLLAKRRALEAKKRGTKPPE